MGRIDEGHIHANGVEFAYLEAGSGPLALCLHGFPDCAWGWRWLLPALADAGFHAVAPFLRGYAPTAIPPDGRYQYGAVVADATALHEALGGDGEAVIIGHDWGAIATYGAVAYDPARWRRAVTAAIPPLVVMADRLLDYDQLRRFWYQFLFLSPWGEAAVAADDLAFVDRLWAEWSPGYDASDVLGPVKDSLRPPASLAAALAYYRAVYDPASHDPELAAQEAACLDVPALPTLYLQGATDGCIPVDVVEPARAVLDSPGSRVEVVDHAGHFLQYEQPEVVNRLIVDFVTSTG